MSVDNLAHLTSEQALADAATFRDAMVRKHSLQDSKWVVFGGSYSGSLAAWFKLKYPHLAVGAVASSAPLFAIIDFKGDVKIGVRTTQHKEGDTNKRLSVFPSSCPSVCAYKFPEHHAPTIAQQQALEL